MHSNHATKLYYSDESCKRSENNFVIRDKNNIKYIYTIEFSSSPYNEPPAVIERLPKEKTPKAKILNK